MKKFFLFKFGLQRDDDETRKVLLMMMVMFVAVADVDYPSGRGVKMVNSELVVVVVVVVVSVVMTGPG